MKISDNSNFTLISNKYTGGDNCNNILIQGDNKEVLPELLNEYFGKIKCIYIDPPYNNGESYHYYNDNVTHNNWIKDMRQILSLLKPLLCKDGSLWISIDDKEMPYLRIEADKIFNKENYAGTIIWQQRKSRENRAVFSYNHEYILVYAKDIKYFKKSRNLLPVDNEFICKKYKNPDNDPRGPWQSVTANVQAGHAVPSQFYKIITPNGTVISPPTGRCWVYNEERMKKEIEEGNIWFGENGGNSPRIKKFLHNSKIGLTPQTIWTSEEVGTTDSAKKQLLKLFPECKNVFETPKPEELLKRIIEIASNKGDLILDCYAGSGTSIATAHKLGRHYIGIEIGEQMSELVVKRLEKVITGDSTGISKMTFWKGGGNFNFYQYNKKPKEIKKEEYKQVNQIGLESKSSGVHYKQLDLFELYQQYPQHIVENENIVSEININSNVNIIDASKNVLISLVKKDNVELFINQTAKIYYTGKKFPSTIALNKLYYFMPYIKNKGIRDLYLIRVARIGTRREGFPNNNPDDLRLVFDIQYVNKLFEDYKKIDLKIWRTYTDTNIISLLTDIEEKRSII